MFHNFSWIFHSSESVVATNNSNLFFFNLGSGPYLQAVNGKTFHSVAHHLDSPRNSRPMDAAQFQIPECRDVEMQIPESPCSFNTHPVRPPENSRSADGFTMHNEGYILRPPHRVPSDQFSFIHAENRPKPQREVPPPPSYSNRQHFVQNTRRENFYNTHERDGMRCNTRALHEQRWNTRTAREERWNSRALREERWNTRVPHEERWSFRTAYEERWNTRSTYSGNYFIKYSGKIMIVDDPYMIFGGKGWWQCYGFALVVGERIMIIFH